METVMTSADTLRVLVVDDHTILRRGLARVLEGHGVEVCGEAEDGREAVRKAGELLPDVVIMDLAMPGLNGLESTERILKGRCDVKVLVLSMYLDDEYVRQAVEAGVAGYVLKDAPTEEILTALRTVAGGGRYFSEQISSEIVARAGERRKQPRRSTKGPLTRREREVLKLLAEGNTVKEVGVLLELSQKTVDTHKTNLMKKLDIHNRVELVQYAIQTKLVQL